MTLSLDCIIPAAGASSRMGAWKPLLPWGSSTIIETVVERALLAGLGAIVVAGYRGRELHALLDGRKGVLVADNPDWDRGMAGSVLAGAELARGEAFFVCPADMPLIGPSIYRALLAFRAAAIRDRADMGIGAPLFAAYSGIPGHPVLIPATLLPALRALDPGSRVRDLLMREPHRLVETGDPACLSDLDTPSDYEAARP